MVVSFVDFINFTLEDLGIKIYKNFKILKLI